MVECLAVKAVLATLSHGQTALRLCPFLSGPPVNGSHAIDAVSSPSHLAGLLIALSLPFLRHCLSQLRLFRFGQWLVVVASALSGLACLFH